MTRILIIEDEEPIRRVLVKILSEENDQFKIFEATDGKDGIKMLENNDFDLVLCDIKMPKMDGLEVLEKAQKSGILVPFIMLTGHGNVETAVHAMKNGAYDFIPKPPDLNRLLISVRNAIASKHLIKENVRLKKKIARKYDIIGSSLEIKKVIELVDKVAPTQARILITGPNGTGKELVAHQIHQKSVRQKFPLIEVNCAAIPSELIESELFGHLKGAFTSAIKDRKGKFEAASQGTLFLDEIGDLSLSAQAKVLRALQENKVQRVGSDKDITVDVRILAATNKDLKEEIKAGRFREDLYHRLAVILIEVPSLSERTEDIPLLVDHFINQIAKKDGMPVKSIEPKALALLKQYPWTGNVRELRNVVERLMILGDNPITSNNIIQFAPK
ncbi:sigma-54 dependent transcriptional regulator [Flavobacteriaceae bacterium]|jgi:DNA-binding NtrC family response regulator|uniref:sigma-54-dependent transcriptional regulator n=1 Tax=Candidatus Arcticimaribacter forsetii TaxID=2820661 RepID=UPI0020770B9B|nr:sigma-54 dependent transcriptional regulator [Candidatus Arcticimaribacter forsetii]MDA8699461.1 sigma-54 dependent transcriptional regulator [Flavobacteriaceae bacterium]MDB2456746.1 sigma-54 dependent transcriptional regulator [Flavobacteriaceae bacterium]MDB4621207.1 sigma-54 dependent transcriptional regulator [Flavobacteriaceae bacterium]MDB4674775.1 sigma-54 dependent transcriptional regulator [Flavobacteriaceae bacterium]MDB4717076.1 sigma-54 dependent transcriptional regulator [Flav